VTVPPPSEARGSLPPWAWIAGVVVAVALLLWLVAG
jgi:hypothetical protein